MSSPPKGDKYAKLRELRRECTRARRQNGNRQLALLAESWGGYYSDEDLRRVVPERLAILRAVLDVKPAPQPQAKHPIRMKPIYMGDPIATKAVKAFRRRLEEKTGEAPRMAPEAAIVPQVPRVEAKNGDLLRSLLDGQAGK
jgi:hypothetical protein